MLAVRAQPRRGAAAAQYVSTLILSLTPFPLGGCAFRPTSSPIATGLHQPSPIVLEAEARAAKQK